MRILLTILAIGLASMSFSGMPNAVAQTRGGGQNGVVSYATRSDTTAPLSAMPKLPPLPDVLGQIFVKPLKRLPNRAGGAAGAPDPVLQDTPAVLGAPTTLNSFEGVGNVNGVLPPDSSGAIGPNHYVQMINLAFAIYDRSGNKIYGPADNNTLWQGFGGPCETTNDGDPIVLYDHLADRWMMSQFALPNYPRGPFYQCIAVSKTPDPTKEWHRYEFTVSNSKLNDYPKFGVWPNGYYMAFNQFSCKFFGCNWGGQGVVAFERDAMLQGQSARMVYFDLYNVDRNLGGMLPADLDGAPPPANTPIPFVQVDDNAWGYSPDQLQIWNFDLDWADPGSATFSFDHALPTAAFDSDLCGYSRNCIPQPGGTNLDALSDRLMYRLQYRDFGDYQTMVVNHSVDANGADRAGIRWYELRDDGLGWNIHQQGTYAPADGENRWMGSAAMNGMGDIALGFSISSGATYPSIHYTGQLAGDPLGQMTQTEESIVDGAGYQKHTSGRWGDYSMLTVDPTDDCTFWYTQEYYPASGNAPWHTRIGSFQLDSCTSGSTDTPPSVLIASPSNGDTVKGVVAISANASDDNGVTQVEFFVDGNSISTDSDPSGGWSASWDTSAATEGNHSVTATATDTIGQTSSDTIIVTVNNVNDLPVAAFDYTCSGLICNFDASGSSDPDGTVDQYEWNFGDGSPTEVSSGPTIAHSYAASSMYTVQLTVTDNNGATNTVGHLVTVSTVLTVELIDPDTMTAGTARDVTITGSAFVDGASVSFENGSGPAPTAVVTSVSPDGTTLMATVTMKSGGPPRARTWDVRVTDPDGSSAALPGAFTVMP